MSQEEFNLSEKIEKIYGGETGLSGTLGGSEDFVFVKDIKEFIRRKNIEEECFLNYLLEYPELLREAIKNRKEEIKKNKFAGDKLI